MYQNVQHIICSKIVALNFITVKFSLNKSCEPPLHQK